MLHFLELKTTYDKVTRAINSNSEPRTNLIVLAEYFKALAANDGAILNNVLDDEPPLDQ